VSADGGDAAERVRPGHAGAWKRFVGPVACVIAVLACEALVFRYLFQYGVSNIWGFDGMSQHFPALHFYRESVLAFLRQPLAGVETWSWRLGFGADVPTTLSYYFNDPFAALSLLFPERWLEYAYEAAYFLRLVAAGLTSYLYLRRMKGSVYGAVLGSLIYVFATFSLYISLRHPYFATALVLFPLILIGIEDALEDRRWLLLVVVAGVAAASNVYFFYQMSIIALVYGIARVLERRDRTAPVRRLVSEVLRVASPYAVGTALAGWILVPTALAVLSSSRGGMPQTTRFLADLGVYAGYVIALATPEPGDYSMFAGFSILAFLLVPVLFTRRGHGALKTMLIAFPLFLVSPFAGSVFNGFGAPSYRFMFMWGLFLACAVAALLSDDRPFTGREMTVMGAGLALYAAAATAAALATGRSPIGVAVMSGLGAAMWVAFMARSALKEPDPARHARLGVLVRGSVFALVVVGIAASGAGLYSSGLGHALTNYMPLGSALEAFSAGPGAAVASLPGAGTARIEVQDSAKRSLLDAASSNDPLVHGYRGTSFYYSIMNGGVFDYVSGLDLRTTRLGFDFNGLDDRATLETLGAVRYYVASGPGARYVPYGFDAVSTIGTSTVYENSHALPIGYVYHRVVPESRYAAMGALHKQQALLQGVVVADGAATTMSVVDVRDEVIDVPYSVSASTGVTFDAASRIIRTLKRNAGLRLDFAAPPGCELYLALGGVDFSLGSESLHVSAGSTGPLKDERMYPQGVAYDRGDRTALINLGYFEDGASTARLRLNPPAEVRFADLRVYALPMDGYASRVATLAAEGMRDVSIGRDSLSGTVTSHGDGLLFLSVPFSTGWAATVDGAAVTPVRANVGFTGIPVGDGTHTVEMKYTTPGLRLGAAVSLIALLIVTAALVRRRPAVRRPPRS